MKKICTICKKISFALVVLLFAIGQINAQPKKIILLTDDTNDDYQYQFLLDQGFDVEKFWTKITGTQPKNWGADTLTYLNSADLLICGRSLNSNEFQDTSDRAVWNALTTPLIMVSSHPARNNRSHWFNSSTVLTTQGGAIADIKLANDTIFKSVTLGAGNTLPWYQYRGNNIKDLSGDTQGEIVASMGDTVPLIVRFAANKAFYKGGPDSAVAPRVYFAFGGEGYEGVAAQSAHFNLTRVAKQVYLAEICRLLGIPQQTVNLPNAYDYNIVFVTDDNKDDYNFNFLKSQKFDVKKFWVAGKISAYSADTITMLNNADLIIIGRSIASSEQDTTSAKKWNLVNTPLIHISPFALRSNLAGWFKSTYLLRSALPGKAKALLANDTVFNNVTLDGDNKLNWFDVTTDGMIDTTGTNQGEWVASINDTIPLLVRFAPNVPFYTGSKFSAVAERVYFGFGMEDNEKLHFPLSRDAKQIYLNEISRLLNIPTPKAVYGASDYTITFMTDDTNDDYNQAFLRAQGFKVNTFWAGDSPNLWSADTLAVLNAADIMIIGRSVNSGTQSSPVKKAVMNALTVPIINCSPYALRTGNANWFKTATIRTVQVTSVADVKISNDPAVKFAPAITGGKGEWHLAPSSNFLFDTTRTSQGEWVIAVGDSVPLVVRFAPNKAFYKGGSDSAVDVRVHFVVGAEPAPNHFNLTKNAQAVYFGEIMRLLGGTITAPKFFGTNKHLMYLAANKGTMSPAFHKDTLSYKLIVDANVDTIGLTATGADATIKIAGAGNILIPEHDTTLYVVCTSEVGQTLTYTVKIDKPTGVKENTMSKDNISIFPNPVNDKITVSATETINSITIYNLQGASVLSRVVNSKSIDMPLGNLNAGIYFIKVQCGDKVFTDKIIKN